MAYMYAELHDRQLRHADSFCMNWPTAKLHDWEAGKYNCENRVDELAELVQALFPKANVRQNAGTFLIEFEDNGKKRQEPTSIEINQSEEIVKEFARKILALPEGESVGYELVPFLTALFPGCRPGWVAMDDKIHLYPEKADE